MKNLAIVGAGDLGRQICQMAIEDNQYKVVGFYDDFIPVGTTVCGCEVLGKLDSLLHHFDRKKFDLIILGIGYKHLDFKAATFQHLSKMIPFGTMIHSNSYVDKKAVIKEGTVIYPGCVIDQNVIIESDVLLHIGCTVAHDTIVKNHTYVSPSVSIAGFSKIGAKCNLGIGTIIIDHIILGDKVQTGGGTVVIRNLDQPGLYVGNPARLVRKNDD